jgi:hypothetical protein
MSCLGALCLTRRFCRTIFPALCASKIAAERGVRAMKTFTEAQRSGLKAAVYAPIAVFPAAFVLMLVGALWYQRVPDVGEALGSVLFIGLWGAAIAYIAAFLYGLPLWLALWKLRRLSLLTISVLALLPAICFLAVQQDLVMAVLVAYFSLAVSTAAWFVNRGTVRVL